MIDVLTKLLTPVLEPMGVSEADLVLYLNLVSNHLLAIAAAFVVMIIILIAAKKVRKGWRAFVRWQAVLGFLLALVLIVNLICYGPLYDNVSGFLNASTVELAEDTVAQSLATIRRIGEEGFVLTKNDGLLPLKEDTKKLNVFGWASVSPFLGGTGSSASNAAAATDLLQSLKNAGFETNQALSEMYRAYCAERPVANMTRQDMTLPEPTAEYYTDELMDEARSFSDTALVVIGRGGGEDYDLPMDMYTVIHGTYNVGRTVSVLPKNYTYFNTVYKNNGDYDDFDEGQSYLELSNTEKAMIERVCSEFEKVILIINSSNTMELSWVDDYEQIGAVILAPAPGVAGFEALGEIISGAVNPSGRTADTFVRDLKATPTINNYGNFSFTNAEDVKIAIARADPTYEGSAAFLNYAEGIYVGYRFYETAADEGLIDYEKVVQYPFGYGLSYTTFKQEITGFKEGKDTISFDVKVTNTGSVKGRDVVEIYYTPPYTNGGIEKSSVNLIDFAKTELLEPGKSQVLSFSFNIEDFASYDSGKVKTENGGYYLEAGNYTISARSDSHTVLDQKTFTVKQDIDYSSKGRSHDQISASNRFEDYSRGDFELLSRKDGFANYDSACGTVLTAEDLLASEAQLQAILENSAAGYKGNTEKDPADVMPNLGKDNGLTLADMAGLDYEDEKWELLLDQMSTDDMVRLVNVGGWQTVEVKSVGKRATSDCDGPAGLNNFITGAYGTTFPAEVLMGQTWSKEVAVEIGTSMGSEFAAAENFGWYGPAMNIHRSAFAGRNFEYYSEDPVLSGYMALSEVQGAAQFGVYSYIKHFVLNDQETNRCGFLLTYASEQAIREINLKPFEMVVKGFKGNSMAVMSAFNWIGTVPCCANGNLLNGVLRGEWGFRGLVETDYDGSYGYMITDHCIRNGNDLMLGYRGHETNKVDVSNPTVVKALRQSSKNILYTICNSGYYTNGTQIETNDKMGRLFITADVSLGVLFALIELALILYFVRKNKKTKQI